MSDEYHGHGTLADGTHVPLTADQAAEIWRACEAAAERRREAMPDSSSALSTMSSAKERLRELGWSDAVYCPKDGSEFAVIEFGSTGIFKGFYSGDWPDGDLIYGGDIGSVHGRLFKAIPDLTEEEAETLARCEADERAHMEREISSISATAGEGE